ncbi:TPI1 (YDR050C) [Zygosaccharomyces parabailii]|uniref:Triosephosphate isomerase n=2 Tax=Zygosaccharomyces bailii TaxID=4954 RepID=TPIS_ZYGBA|nr:RecName: Full=Triosephosphate isomerase; Short=TIM; AltName: Full=Triose-phosphate isomerase [Zygosaccharomyces bailii]AQZ18148.1 TPI1 (YDR050C) [Zygosaccharomyces parabailii]CDF91589.1 ZYBA0S12-02388g1_1 [Zygosaccharomyces bailii CLIB 213]CDH11049.1 Triosephosphate isomerase [Zygosaccharomyces bailii ISA1307]AAG50278.1 triose phosphate isomerase [Zygosaccharomyces bailii]SJM86407.1 Triosephosphate isomerase [Zygosaccharomyces bailii]
MARTFFVGGNFKLNGTKSSIKEIVERLNNAKLDPKVEVVLCPPAPYLDYTVSLVKKSQVSVGAQNAYLKASGAFTGENSVDQIKDVGAKWVILGHSERRQYFREDDQLIAEKTAFALSQGVGVILCIGETLDQKKAGTTLQVVERQLQAVIDKVKDWSNVVIAYEPVWAIGTGLAATPEDAQEIHHSIREFLAKKLGEKTAQETRILYGGSANGKNAVTFKDKPDVDGFLVGGASLKPEFVDIINSRS